MDGLKISEASFEDAHALKCAVLSVAQKSGFKFEDLLGDDNLNVVLNLVISLDSDKDVYNALWPCLEKCTYKKEKITKATFESPEMRKNYFPIAAKCIEENLTPFIVGLRSVWIIFQNAIAQSAARK